MPEIPPLDQFQKVLSVADSLFKGNQIQVRFGPTGRMRFIIDESHLKHAATLAGIEERTFREIFDSEVSPLLEAVIRGAVDQYIETSVRSHARALSAQQKEVRDALPSRIREEADLVKRFLVTPELRARYLVKVSSKHPRLRTSSWEVANKIELSTKEPWRQPYATISYETTMPESSAGALWFAFFPTEVPGRSEFCTFDCDEGDLDDLIQSLQDAKTALRKARKGDVT